MEILIGAVAVFFMLKLVVQSVLRVAPKPVRPKRKNTPHAKQKSEVPRAIDRALHRDNRSASRPVQPRVLMGSAWITDGDSIWIQNTQIRLFGIDAPELNHPYGIKAKWALHKLCKHQSIRAEVTDVDHYGRTVAKCYLPDGRDLSAEMVKQGLALDWPRYSGRIYQSLETDDARKKLFLADARQKGRMHVWEQYEARQKANSRA